MILIMRPNTYNYSNCGITTSQNLVTYSHFYSYAGYTPLMLAASHRVDVGEQRGIIQHLIDRGGDQHYCTTGEHRS